MIASDPISPKRESLVSSKPRAQSRSKQNRLRPRKRSREDQANVSRIRASLPLAIAYVNVRSPVARFTSALWYRRSHVEGNASWTTRPAAWRSLRRLEGLRLYRRARRAYRSCPTTTAARPRCRRCGATLTRWLSIRRSWPSNRDRAAKVPLATMRSQPRGNELVPGGRGRILQQLLNVIDAISGWKPNCRPGSRCAYLLPRDSNCSPNRRCRGSGWGTRSAGIRP